MKSRAALLGFCLLCPALAAPPRPPQWIQVSSPHFTVLSDGGSRDARHVASQLESMRAIFGQMFPALPLDPVAPLEVIAVRNAKEFRTLEPAAYLGKGKLDLAGYFQSAPDRNYILLRLDTQASDHPYSVIYHEYTHLLTSRLPTPLPVWLSEGLAEFYETTEFSGHEAYIGKPSVGSIGLLRQRQLMPLAQLFAVDDTSPYYHEQDKASIFYAEAWALTHMIMIGDEQQHTAHLANYLAALNRGQDSATAAATAFGPLPALQQQLSQYIRHWTFSYVRLQLKQQVDEDRFTLVPVSQPAAQAEQADLLAHVGRYADAAALAHTVLATDPKSARAAEALGLIALRQNDLAAAQSWYGKAVDADAQDFLAQFSYGELTFRLHQGQLDAPTAAAAARSLRQAIALRPGFAPAYDRLAVLDATRHQDLPGAATLERTAVRLSPREIVYRFNLAWILVNDRQPAAAVTALQQALPLASTDAEAQECRQRLANAQQFADQKAMADHFLAERSGTGSGAAPAGPQQYLEGVIQSAVCGTTSAAPFSLQLALTTAAGVVKLQSPDYLKVSFIAANFVPTGALNPCHDLAGLHASVHAAAGQILDVTLRR